MVLNVDLRTFDWAGFEAPLVLRGAAASPLLGEARGNWRGPFSTLNLAPTLT